MDPQIATSLYSLPLDPFLSHGKFSLEKIQESVSNYVVCHTDERCRPMQEPSPENDPMQVLCG